MLKEFGSERLIGMLHAFVLLKPVLSKALRDKEEQVLRVADLSRFSTTNPTQANGQTTLVNLDANEVQERLDELHESMEDTCSQFNRTL